MKKIRIITHLLKETSALIPAAGRGLRFGSSENKVFTKIAGKPILAHTIAAFQKCDSVDEIVLVVGEDDIEAAEELISRYNFGKVSSIVIGGANRQDSVRVGLEHISGNLVAIHDGARPLVDLDIIKRSFDIASKKGACIAAVPVVDTIKSADVNGLITSTIDRSEHWHIQTPQTFKTELIKAAHKWAFGNNIYTTDDAALVETYGKEVYITLGSYKNIKITNPEDAVFASGVLGGPQIRTGIGIDIHKLAPNIKLILGGVEIPFNRGLIGHSDADVLIHSIMDGCLGAANLGDIGKHFPDTDLKYKDISSLELLKHVSQLLITSGWQIGNIDVMLLCERPKIAQFIPQMQQNIASALNTDPNNISIKATTAEGLGFVGVGDGVVCYATVLIHN
jgi:2-C-methyl-D-erythritol 4-phosphate cytidylyltransferase / 2-C-methyl-D-erythritol 2,4-cyclodiphosphate synthase